MLNSLVIMGRLTKDPEHKQLSSGVTVCKFTVAVDRKFVNKQTNERETDFIDCQAWRGTADFISRYFSKGSMIAVEGTLQNNNWTDNDGKKHYSYIVQVEQAHFCGGKNESGQAQSGTEQTGAVQSAQQSEPLNIGELGEFEQSVSNGEVPF